MIRRHALAALAVLAMGLVVSAPAEAGGTSGAVGVKKNANVIIKNTTTSPYYVLVIPESLDYSSTKFGTPGTVGWARNLGAASVSPGRSLQYPVPAGPGGVFIFSPGAVPSNPNATIPDPVAVGAYTVAKGKSVTKTIKSGTGGPVIE